MKSKFLLMLIGVASIGIAKDLIMIMNGATYTWFGLVTGLINISIIGKSLDYLRG